MTPTATAPAMPYAVQDMPYGIGRTHPTKVYPHRTGGDLLTPDELAVHEYVQYLEAENARLKGELVQAAEQAKKGRR